jgi:hypothetical protein
MKFLLLPLLAQAFSSAPTKECRIHADCVLVRDTFCQEILAIRIGQDEQWAKEEAKLRKKYEKEGRICKAREQEDPRLLEATCTNGLCVVQRKVPAK